MPFRTSVTYINSKTDIFRGAVLIPIMKTSDFQLCYIIFSIFPPVKASVGDD